ncbi:SDR family NAD(P)-dependent oxidoreductase [Gloeobacter morelensis MG652769]|uniref:SDR family NAD(P)-dependent oxidoreductase n=1 Tax=Gloeobacter morelensis MG652769 TaxID=2781736 RepID=A0ABY3PGN5_9CYAN|nr:SDR family NAD(P)-dependent oxidoreductase [Gloeobacter morelensis MG652769]
MNFACLAISPIEFTYPGIAIATVRAGGVGILDREFCPDGALPVAAASLRKLRAAAGAAGGVCGLRLAAGQVGTSVELLRELQGQPHWLVISAWEADELAAILAGLGAVEGRRVLLEVIDIEQAERLAHAAVAVDGLVARGHECGGWVGEDSAFVLAQKLLQAGFGPLYVQGGIGVHTAAACRVAGAAGVVLDDQMWLMPESPLDPERQRHLNELNGQEAVALGERLDMPCRVLARPGFAAIASLQALAERLDLGEDRPQCLRQWRVEAAEHIGWGDPAATAWPLGQAIGLAASLRDRYRTVGRLVQAILKESARIIETARRLQPLKPAAPLAESHRTEYPIVQGPMTRVSDTAEFAEAVARGGGLPLLALALMRGEQVHALLSKTRALLGDRSWGVGILGFVSHALREEQLKAVKEIKPPFALIAGGRPDQAAHLESIGIATYIHVPVPRLLKMFLEQGACRFVFEGRECGGHVGPLSSFLLWESMVQMLLAEVSPDKAGRMHILFAGGIHDAASAAMVSALAAPLAERGMKVGVLMGSAYLFTEEAVSCGAIVPQFQQQAIACRRTINLETGPGHASRCAVTPFAHEFYQTRRRMLQAGNSAEEVKNGLEDLTLGRLRTASKGMVRGPAGIEVVDEPTQIKDGMYMIGQVATMRDRVCTVRDLHAAVSEIGSEQLAGFAESAVEAVQDDHANRPCDIAVVGIGTLLPGALDGQTYWENILKKVSTISEIPAHRWDWRLYFDSDRNKRDKVYSRWGSFLEDVPFDPVRFGIPPKSLRSIEPMQLLALEAVRQAIADAGYETGEFDREHTSVIFGIGGSVGDLGQQYAARSEIPRIVGHTDPEVYDRLPEWTEESFPGLLANVVAGRVANRFNFGGSNFTVDAACASSLAAIHLAVRDLETGHSAMVIAGGVDTSQGPFPYFCFSKTQALTPGGKPRPFDQAADGIVIGEGLAMVVLKRLADAERDGDRIYAVIKSTAGSSDGKALGMTAPLPAGQKRAVQRAYRKAGFSPKTLGLYEAHGTGTALGDRSELTTLTETLVAEQAQSKSCAIGSVKVLIGHTKSTAGVAALIKASLALHRRVLPAHPIDTPLAAISDPQSPVYLLSDARPWFAEAGHPRRAGVSAFGFGGTNFHAVLEEYTGGGRACAPGADGWPLELFVWQAGGKDALLKDLRAIRQAATSGVGHALRDLAYTCARQAQTRGVQPFRLAIVAGNLKELSEAIEQAEAALASSQPVELPDHIRLGFGPAVPAERVAFVFPGQGSQYPNMGREAALYRPELRDSIEAADALLAGRLPRALSALIYPPAAHGEADEARQRQELTHTQVAQPALGAIEAGFLDLATNLGLAPAVVCGHSYGEYAALHAAGGLTREDFLRLSEVRGRVMATACGEGDGAMAAVMADRTRVEAILAELGCGGEVIVANHNAPNQIVLSGDRSKLLQIVEHLVEQGGNARMLDVAGAFHSPRVQAAQAPMAEAIAQAAVQPPTLPVYANANARPYPLDPQAIREQLGDHLLNSVEFVEQIRAMHTAGARVFIEIGPKMVLTRLIGQILTDSEHTAVSLDGQGGGLRGLLLALGTLAASGVNVRWSALFDGRPAQLLSPAQLAASQPPRSATAWLINGGVARPAGEPVAYTGKNPPLTLETAPRVTAVVAPREQPATPLPPAPAKPAAPVQAATTPAPPSAPAITVVSHAANGPASAPASANGRTNGHMPVAPAAAAPVSSVPVSPGAPPGASPGPSKLPTTQGNSMSNDLALQAYMAYQQTMRQFLATEEQVMRHFLQFAAGRPLSAPLAPAAPPMLSAMAPAAPALPAPAPVVLPTASPPAAPMAPPPPTPTAGLTVHPPVLPVAPVANGSAAHGAPTPAKSANGAATLAPAAAAAVRFDREGLTRMILELVSERTGYPAEVLGLDQDVEAELGIDSIKRVEIMGALQKALPAEWTAPLQSQMESLTRAKTLNILIEQLLALGGASASPAVAAPAAAAAVRFDREGLTRMILELVSERTGYPAEVLGLDQDVEAELGIDSIKRVEIMGALQKALPAEWTAPLQSQMESLTRAKTLNILIEQLLALGAIPSTAAEGGQSPKKSSSAAEAAPRYLMEARTLPLPRTEGRTLSGLFLITEDALGVAGALAPALQAAGARSALIPAAVLQSPELLGTCMRELRERFGPASGVVHLTALARPGSPQSLAEWRVHTQVQAKSFFQMLHDCSADLLAAGANAHVVAASYLGGQLGRGGTIGPGLAVGGAACGFVKTVAQEWPEAHAKALDFDESQNPAQIAACIVAELLAADSRQEVGYPDGRRTVFQATPAPFTGDGPPRLVPGRDWVTLVVGGARGITAEIATDLAATGMTLIVCARSPVPTPESVETAGIENIATLRKIFMTRLQASGRTPTPAAIEQQVQNLLKERAISQNLARFAQLGARVGYHSVGSEAELIALVEDIYARYGRLDAVINGAGIIEDKLIADKSFESFSRVFDTKVDLAFTLTRCLRPETLKLVVLFSSVAGRFGNRGQVDYAAANEVLNRMAFEMRRQWPATRVISFNWGPWDSGMATEAIKAQFRKRNVVPISLPAGRQAFLEELTYGPLEDVEVVVGEGPWETAEATRGNFKPEAASTAPVRPFALIRTPFVLQPNTSVTLDHTFTLASDPYLRDHSMDGKAVLPATVALEWLAEFVQHAWPDQIVSEVRDLRVLRGVVLDADSGAGASKRVTLSARASVHADADALEVSAEIFDPEKKAPFYRALVVMRPRLEGASVGVPAPLAVAGSALDIATAYRDHTFHGPHFQLLTALDRLGEQGIDARVRPSEPARFFETAETLPGWLFDPGLLDTIPQLALFWARTHQGSFALPSRIGRVVRFDSEPPAGSLRIAFRLTSVRDHQIVYDATVIDSQGRVRLVLEDGESNCSRALNRLARCP